MTGKRGKPTGGLVGKSTGTAAGKPTGKLPFPDAALVAYGKAHPGTGLTIGVVLELEGPPPDRRQLAASLRPVTELLGTGPSDGDPWSGADGNAEAGPERGLSDVAHEALARPLEPHRWSCSTVAGLQGDTSALVWRADHRLLDGAGVVGLLAAWTGAHGSGAHGSAALGPGAHGPGALGTGAHGSGAHGSAALGSGAHGPEAHGPDTATASPARAEPWRARGAPHRAVTDPLRAAWLCGTPLLARRRGNVAEAAGGPPATLSYACVETDLGLLRGIARRHGTTVNDVYLAALSGALRTRPELHGPHGQSRALVPVNVRGPGDAAVLRNRHIPLRIPLPVAEPDAGRRLALVAARTAGRARALRHPLVRAVFRSVPAAAGGWCFERYFDPARATLLASNVRGPSSPLVVAGRRVLRVLPLNFLPAGHRMSAVLATAQGRAVAGFTTSEPRRVAESFADAWLGELRVLATAGPWGRGQAAGADATASPAASAR
ncbi:WS/DGAT domain-containing protein [Streptomyces yatensis]|uniref:Diacylglycerol O-acyltransferase n=1 Tax=Streptomyces yatensis TaxID=155177 RepID=A0ABP4SWQ9_9ACTN|nr:WS/DGAT domain-containing protein [Streptomyces yatensis]